MHFLEILSWLCKWCFSGSVSFANRNHQKLLDRREQHFISLNTPLCERDNTTPIVGDPGTVSQEWINIVVDAGHAQMGTFFGSIAPIFSFTCKAK